MKIVFKKMSREDVPLWEQWCQKPYIKDLWFIDGYEPKDYIHQKVIGNGYDYPFIIFIDDAPIGYIVCCDLYAYRNLFQNPKGIFTQEEPGTFCMDLFIGEEACLNKGYGTEIVKQFTDKIFKDFNAKIIYIDPTVTNKRAIRCYEKAGFKFSRIANDGITDCYVMELKKVNG